MNSYSELPNLGSGFRQAHAGRLARPGRWRLVKGLESAVRRSIRGISRWHQRRRAIRELQALSDHHLADIGMDRSRIVSVVEEMQARPKKGRHESKRSI